MSNESFEDVLERFLAEQIKNPPGVRTPEQVDARNRAIFERTMDEDYEG